jgi:Fe-S-cluster containining protein
MTLTNDNDNPVGLGALVPEAFKIADRIARNGVAREAKFGSKVSCNKGCSACCTWLVRVSIPEALYLYECIFGCETCRRNRILEKFHKGREILKQNGFAETLKQDLIRQPGDVSYDHRLHLLSRRYHSLKMPCPLLKEKTCSIYLWRPIVCRQYYATSPAGWCMDPFTKNVRRVSLTFDVTGLLADVAADILSQPRRMIALPLILDWAAEHEHLAKLRWPQQELLTRFLKGFKRPQQFGTY